MKTASWLRFASRHRRPLVCLALTLVSALELVCVGKGLQDALLLPPAQRTAIEDDALPRGMGSESAAWLAGL